MKTLRKFYILAAFLCCLASMTLPAKAAGLEPPTDSFGISFTLRFFNNGVVEEPLEAYQQNSFLLMDSSGWYLQAEYSAADNAYHLTGWTLEDAAATRLRCGQSPEELGRVATKDLPNGTFFLTQREVTEEYSLLDDPVEISVNAVGTEINGQPVHNNSSDGTASFMVHVIIPFPFPKLYSSTWQMIRESKLVQLTILAEISVVISAVYLLIFCLKTIKHRKEIQDGKFDN